MRKLASIIVLSLLALAVIAQNAKFDSLERSARALKGKLGVEAMNNLGALLVQEYPARAELMANDALGTAQKIGDWKGMASAYHNLGAVATYRLHYLKALNYYQKSLDISKQHKDELGLARSNIEIGSTLFSLDEPDQAVEKLREGLSLAKNINWGTGVAKAHDLLGEINFSKGNFPDALMYFKAAFNIWSGLSNNDKAGKAAKQVAETSLKLGDMNGAETFLGYALDRATQIGSRKDIAAINQSWAKALFAKNKLAEAENRNQVAFEINSQQANTLGMAENQWLFGKIAFAKGSKINGLERFEQAMVLLEGNEPSAAKLDILEELSTSCRNMGESSFSKKFETAAIETKSLVAEKELVSRQQLLHELLAERPALVSLQNHLAFLQGSSSNDKSSRKLMFVLLGLVGFMTALVYIFYKKSVNDNQLLVAQNEEIQLQKTEQAELNKELVIKNISLELLNKKLVEEIAERESLERSSFARERFLATMSHEMRNPLNAITGLTHLLMELCPLPEQIEHLRTLQFSANELVVLINDVLDYSNIETGKLDLHGREFDLLETAGSVFYNFEKKALEKNLHFYCSVDSEIPKRLIGDDSRFYQILNNLLSSCYDSTSEGVVRAEIFLEEQKEREVVIKLVVECSDGGNQQAIPGRGQIWDAAENHQEALHPRQLSLAVTKRLVELQHGRFGIENIFGEATRFTVLMPFKNAFTFQNNTIQLGLTDFSQLRGVKVLVVEDNKINQLVVAKLLRQHGMTVITADNGYEALEQYELHSFDLILMDIQMPEMDGYRATAEIRNHPSHAKQNVPIIALTSSAFLTEKEKAVLFGMTDYVGKPFSPDELLEKIANCLEYNRRY